jgi:hypothetical protein
MDIPLNLDKIIGMTEAEARDWIKLHDSNVNLHIANKDGQKMSIINVQSNSVYVSLEDEFITSYFIT